jgi:phage/plasmid-like protein (TIGR03299 family)
MHEVETLAYTGQLPWHGLGINLGDELAHITGNEMLSSAGLDWTTYKDEIKDSDDNEIPGWYAVRRKGNNLMVENTLGIVQEKFTCIQNADIFGVPDALVAEGKVTYEVAGSLREGAIVFALARMSDFEIKRLGGYGDPVERYLLWTAGHGNGRAVIGGYTDIRVVCKNTLDCAMGDKLGSSIQNRFTIRHTRHGPERIAEAHRILLKLDENGKRQQEIYQDLAMTPISLQQSNTFYSEWFNEEYGNLTEDTKNYETRASKREAIVGQLSANFQESPGNTGESAWDTYNGLTYWLDHQRSRVRNAATRMNSILLGGQVYNQKGRAAKKLMAWTRDGKLTRAVN